MIPKNRDEDEKKHDENRTKRTKQQHEGTISQQATHSGSVVARTTTLLGSIQPLASNYTLRMQEYRLFRQALLAGQKNRGNSKKVASFRIIIIVVVVEVPLLYYPLLATSSSSTT